MYTITIVYTGPKSPESVQFVSPICPIYTPSNSYADTTAYAGTVYDTNVAGFGKIDLMEPYASTSFPYPVPLAQFKLAIVGETQNDGSKKVEFTVDTYQEAFWYKTAGEQLKDQGFTVTVAESEG